MSVWDALAMEHILFLDIETVPQEEKFDDLEEEMKSLFEQKTAYQRGEVCVEEFYSRAGIWAEFGKIVCISVGFMVYRNGDRQFRTTSFFGDEKVLLQEFANLVQNHYSRPQHVLCGHNSKEFDIPYLARRMIVNQVVIPQKLQLFGKKPWEVEHLDTMDLWKFGDYKHFTSLKLLTKVLEISSPKEDIEGSQVASVYYTEKDLDRIVTYCERDVVAVAQVLLRFKGEALLGEYEIKSV